MSTYSIQVENASKRFRKNLKSFKDIGGYLLGIASPNDFWALKDINFNLEKGDSVGIVGKNGAGKSTLLKMIAHITQPTQGSIKTEGRVAGLIELGAGFHHELTGRENIFLYGAILGMSKKDIESKFDSIVAFSELEEWLETPIKFDSSGMFVRLGFAITVHCNPDILIIDEALSVGDEQFQKKCIEKIEMLKKEGKTILFVSHNVEIIKKHMKKTMYMEHGTITKIESND